MVAKAKRSKRLSMNAEVWVRDGGQCILCGSRRIIGLPGQTGAHHILGRNRPDSNAIEHCCLLCCFCHTDGIHTVTGRGRCLHALRQRHGYEYPPDITWYIEQFEALLKTLHDDIRDGRRSKPVKLRDNSDTTPRGHT